MLRRVVNLVVKNHSTDVHSVLRIDPYKHLFYQSAEEAASSNTDKGKVDSTRGMKILARPDPVMSFAPSPPCMGGLDLFALLGTGGSEGRIISANAAGQTVLYDVDERLFLNLAWLNKPKRWNPVCLSIALPDTVEDSLYVIDRRPSVDIHYPRKEYTSSCFEVLEYGGKEVRDTRRGWQWRLLPPPPFVLQPGYEPSYITSYTTVLNANGCSTIYISCDSDHQEKYRSCDVIGTYCFDTSRHLEEWRQLGEWTLPFHGKAQYIPEFNLWFGFSAHDHKHLCALDLSAMEQDQQQPVLRYLFEDLNPPVEEDWSIMSFELVNLGAGKFCVVKSFDPHDTIGQQFAVLAGIEIVRGDDQGLHMVRHKLTAYGFAKDIIEWVL